MIESIEQKDIEFLVSTGKLKYSMPASLSKAEKITSIKRMEEIVDENCEEAEMDPGNGEAGGAGEKDYQWKLSELIKNLIRKQK